MKILMVNDYYEKIGGAEQYMHDLTENLRKKGHLVEFFTSNRTKREYYQSVTNQTILLKTKSLFNLFVYLSFKRKIQKFNPDVIHIHSISHELSLLILHAVTDYNTIMTIHNYQLISSYNYSSLKGLVYEAIKSKLLKNVTTFITPSYHMEKILRQYKLINIKTIYPFTSMMNYQPVSNTTEILFLGRIVKEKGVKHLIKAIQCIKPIIPKISLKVIGDGTELSSLKQLVKKLNLKSNVKFISQIKHEDIKKYLNNCSIVVMPVVWAEPFGLTAIEAFSAGRPVIASNIGALSEIITNGYNGYLVEPSNSRQLAEKIINLLRSGREKINEMGLNACHTVEKKFDKKKHIEKILSIYNKKFIN